MIDRSEVDRALAKAIILAVFAFLLSTPFIMMANTLDCERGSGFVCNTLVIPR